MTSDGHRQRPNSILRTGNIDIPQRQSHDCGGRDITHKKTQSGNLSPGHSQQVEWSSPRSVGPSVLAGGGGSSTRFHHRPYRVRLAILVTDTSQRHKTSLSTGTPTDIQPYTLRPTALLWTATDTTPDGHRRQHNGMSDTGNLEDPQQQARIGGGW